VTTAAQTTTTTAAPTTSTTADPASAYFPKSMIKKIVEGTLGPREKRKVEVEQIDGGYEVFVEINALNELTAGMIRGMIESDMAEVYIQLFLDDLDVKTATVAAYFPVTDEYGVESETVIYKSRLNKSEADKVNWQAGYNSLRDDILPGVWETIFLHPDLQ